ERPDGPPVVPAAVDPTRTDATGPVLTPSACRSSVSTRTRSAAAAAPNRGAAHGEGAAAAGATARPGASAAPIAPAAARAAKSRRERVIRNPPETGNGGGARGGTPGPPGGLVHAAPTTPARRRLRVRYRPLPTN